MLPNYASVVTSESLPFVFNYRVNAERCFEAIPFFVRVSRLFCSALSVADPEVMPRSYSVRTQIEDHRVDVAAIRLRDRGIRRFRS